MREAGPGCAASPQHLPSAPARPLPHPQIRHDTAPARFLILILTFFSPSRSLRGEGEGLIQRSAFPFLYSGGLRRRAESAGRAPPLLWAAADVEPGGGGRGTGPGGGSTWGAFSPPSFPVCLELER